jgi:hypothetical protein
LCSMLKAVLRNYPHADPDLLNQVSVLFLHAGSRGKALSLSCCISSYVFTLSLSLSLSIF